MNDETARKRMAEGVEPLSNLWGRDRGLAIHRYYLEQFLEEFAEEIKGRCLEFQNPEYAPHFGREAIEKLDILHIDESNPLATIVGDLTKDDHFPVDAFDCIVCTHVLHVVFDFVSAVKTMHRMLKPKGALLVAVPQVSMCGLEYNELWRFTPEGLQRALETVFDPRGITVRGYGNSLTSAAEIRGLVRHEFTDEEIDAHDPRFAVEVCALARK